MAPRNINKMMEDADQALVSALSGGMRAKAAAAIQDRRCIQAVKGELIANGDIPDTPNPPRKPKPSPKPNTGRPGGGRVRNP